MPEYVEREAVIDLITRRYENPEICTQEINSIPAADAASVVHGHWISLTECANEGVYCSICKKKIWQSDYARCSKKSRNKLRSNYCPNCGAKIDEKED